jgi:ATP-dependent Clp protease ATP-binding subunit ClpC
MFDRLTDRARSVMGHAREEAASHCHDYIGPEHLLLGLVIESSAVGLSVLQNLGVDLREMRLDVEKLMAPGDARVTGGQLPFTPGAKEVFEFSLGEADNFGHHYLGTEHLLLGLILQGDGVAASVLRTQGVTVEHARREVLDLLGCDPESADSPGGTDPLHLVHMRLDRIERGLRTLRREMERLRKERP